MTIDNDVASLEPPTSVQDAADAGPQVPRTARRRTAIPRSGLLYARRDVEGPVVGRPGRPPAAIPGVPQLVDDDVDVDQISECWVRYKHAGSSQDREQLILHYSQLVAQVASRLSMRLPSSVEHADLTSYGMFGLIDAIDKFEPGRDVKFETYASARIRGSILDGLRSADWIPRSVRSRTRALSTAISDLEASLHREPTRAELAEHLGVTTDDVRQIETHAASSGLMALDELLDAGDRVEQQLAGAAGHGARTDPAQLMESKEMRFLLGQAICQLPERDRLVVVLYHFEGLTLAEIGRVLGVTESRVSQMHTAAMRALREKLLGSVS